MRVKNLFICHSSFDLNLVGLNSVKCHGQLVYYYFTFFVVFIKSESLFFIYFKIFSNLFNLDFLQIYAILEIAFQSTSRLLCYPIQTERNGHSKKQATK